MADASLGRTLRELNTKWRTAFEAQCVQFFPVSVAWSIGGQHWLHVLKRAGRVDAV